MGLPNLGFDVDAALGAGDGMADGEKQHAQAIFANQGFRVGKLLKPVKEMAKHFLNQELGPHSGFAEGPRRLIAFGLSLKFTANMKSH
jgi:hypothetical protein